MAQVNPLWAFGSALAYVGLVILVDSLRFDAAGRMVLAPRQPFARWAQVVAVSRAFLYALPASAGADGAIWFKLRRHGWSHASCVQVLLMTRLLGVGVWSLAAAFSLFACPSTADMLVRAPAWLRQPLTWALIGLVVLGLAGAAPKLLSKFKQQGLDSFSRKHLLVGVGLAILSALVNAGGVLAAARAMHISMTLGLALGFMAFFNFAMILPISLGGFGLQEALLLTLGTGLGCSAPDLLACSAIVHLQRLLLALVGGVVLLMERGRPQSSAVQGTGFSHT